MTEPTFIPIGYYLKHVAGPQEWLKVPNVEEICSVSGCISSGPSDAIHKWIHNDLGLYDSPELAWQIVGSPTGYTLFACEALPVIFSLHGEKPWQLPTLSVEPLSDRMEFIGHDVAGRSLTLTFEHSPLSCNGMAEEIPVNRYCLIDSFEEAYRAAIRFGREQPEPADYYLLRVYREMV